MFRRPRLRSRRHVIDLRFGDQQCYVWLPSPDEPLVITEFSDAASLATSVLDMGGVGHAGSGCARSRT